MNRSTTTSAVRFGVLGTARIATRVGPAIRDAAGAELSVIASRDGQKAATWASEHGATRSVQGYEALLDDPDIDAVYIPLPPSLHRQWTLRAAQAGKHVLCEKPLAASSSEAAEMAAACAEHGVQLMDGVMWLHHPRAEAMRQIVLGGELGTLRRVTSAFSFCWDALPHGDLRLSRALGGGSLLDLGWYCVGAALWAYGRLPHRVFGSGSMHDDVDLDYSGMMWFGEQQMASFDCGFFTQARRWLEVAGTEASLVCDDFTRPWDESRPRFWLHGRTGKIAERVSEGPLQEVCMVEDFCRIIRSGRLEPRWPDLAVSVQRVCEALDRSARQGCVIELDTGD